MLSTAAGLGMSNSGVREIANAESRGYDLRDIGLILLLSLFGQGLIASLVVWYFRDIISLLTLGSTEYSTEIAIIGISVLFTLLAQSQTAFIQGMRRIADLGKLTILATFGGTVVGLTFVWFYDIAGLIWFVLIQPIVLFLLGLFEMFLTDFFSIRILRNILN